MLNHIHYFKFDFASDCQHFQNQLISCKIQHSISVYLKRQRQIISRQFGTNWKVFLTNTRVLFNILNVCSNKPFKKIAISVLLRSLQKSNFFFVFIFGEEAIPPQKRRHAAAVFFFGCEKLLHFKLLLLLMLLCMPCLCLYKKHSISSKSHGQKPNKKTKWVEAER